MFCPNCGKELPNEAKFCDSCGADVNTGANANSNANSDFANQQNQNTNFANQQNFTNPPPMKAPISERNLVLAIILSLVTCGIYSIYWLICLANDVNTVSGNENDTSGGIVFLLGLVTCGIYLIVWAYKAGQKLDDAKRNYGVENSTSGGVLHLILFLLGFSTISMALMQNDLNKIARH